jgi:hypothetical protein
MKIREKIETKQVREIKIDVLWERKILFSGGGGAWFTDRYLICTVPLDGALRDFL